MIAVHLENGRVNVQNRPWPRRRPGDALIRLIAAGICNTDLELQRGYYNFRGTPGHEFIGEVVDAADQALLGRRVVGEINLACGRCDWCKRGLERHCPRRTVLGIAGRPGVFSEYFTLPEANLHLVPDAISDDHAVFVEPIAAACEILEQVRIHRRTPVAVLGDGKLGLLVAQVLHANKLEVHLFGKHKEKLAIASAAGIRSKLTPAKPPAAAYDWVVEATGTAGGLKQAVAMTRPRGTVILKSTVHGDVSMDTAPVVVNEITLVGSRCGRFEPALDLLRKGKIRLDEMIRERLPLSEAPRAFRRAARPGALKVLLYPG
jgi:threonine dehydrogenase-like Zn-dependent dehydrogenase